MKCPKSECGSKNIETRWIGGGIYYCRCKSCGKRFVAKKKMCDEPLEVVPDAPLLNIKKDSN